MTLETASPAEQLLVLPHKYPVEVEPAQKAIIADNFDIDANTGFLPSVAALDRIPPEVSEELQAWERTLEEGLALGVKLGDRLHLYGPEQTAINYRWRASVRELPVLDASVLEGDIALLRRGRQVLVFLMHLYIHSAPPPPFDATLTPHVIPACLTIPLVRISAQLGIPPILTYADNSLWDWHTPSLHPLALPTESALRSRTLFSGTPDEEHFYLTSTRIELRGAAALGIVRSTLDDLSIGDATVIGRITTSLKRLSSIIDGLTTLLLAVRERCDPAVFYHQVRPWLRGPGSDNRGWVFEGVESSVASQISSLSGPSAGQSSLIHVLDIFLGINHERGTESTFLTKMEQYMHPPHRMFLQHLRRHHHLLRNFVLSAHAQTFHDRETGRFVTMTSSDGSAPRAGLYQGAKIGESEGCAVVQLQAAYDSAVSALKRFRDGHIKIATLYVVSQARASSQVNGAGQSTTEAIKGTGGTSLVPFLKECRDNTVQAMLYPPVVSCTKK